MRTSHSHSGTLTACPKQPLPRTSPWMRSEGLKMRCVRSPGSTRRDSERTMSLFCETSDNALGDSGHLSMLQLRLRKRGRLRQRWREIQWLKDIWQSLPNVPGSNPCASLVLRWREAHPLFICFLFFVWLFLQTRELCGRSKFVMETRVRTVDSFWRILWLKRRKRVVLNGQLKWSACVLNDTVYLENTIWS